MISSIFQAAEHLLSCEARPLMLKPWVHNWLWTYCPEGSSGSIKITVFFKRRISGMLGNLSEKLRFKSLGVNTVFPIYSLINWLIVDLSRGFVWSSSRFELFCSCSLASESNPLFHSFPLLNSLSHGEQPILKSPLQWLIRILPKQFYRSISRWRTPMLSWSVKLNSWLATDMQTSSSSRPMTIV